MGILTAIGIAYREVDAAVIPCSNEAKNLVSRGEEKLSNDELASAASLARKAYGVSPRCREAHWLAARTAQRRMHMSQKIGDQEDAKKARSMCWDEVVQIGGVIAAMPEAKEAHRECEEE